jgi:Ni,Fe-hydrogenase III large subunit/Ni,Fe-hydrogenase III component G
MGSSVHLEIITRLKETFNEQITVESGTPSLLYLRIDAPLVRTLAEYVALQLEGRFITCVATDLRKEEGTFRLLHLFSLDKAKTFLGIKTDVNPSTAVIDSITPVIPGANWAERELKDMIGITAQGHPDLRRLILADDWPEEAYPLRKDFPFDYKPASVSGVAPGLKSPPASTTVLPLGSFHAQKEITTYLNLFVYGEKVVDADYRGFYNHRGLEKMGESAFTYHHIPFIAERICACCGFSHSTCYCQAIESAAHLEIPPRAKYIRTLLLEIERLYSHSLWLASLCNMEGFASLFLRCCSLQQDVLDLAQFLTGNRIIFDMNIIGGIQKDIPKDAQDRLPKLIDRIEGELKFAIEALKGEFLTFSQLKGVSTLPPTDVRRLCTTGIIARASGITVDARVNHPYAAYESLGFKPITRDEGDNFARVSLRLDEMVQSLTLMRESLEKMPEGEINLKVEEIPPHTDSISAVESPRGETVHYILTGENNRPLRWKIKAAPFSNLQVLPIMLRGTNIADARISINSIDPCFSCTEH